MPEKMEPSDKKIDNSWKDAIEKEKTEGPSEAERETAEAEINFSSFIASLSFQTLIALGDVESPITKKIEKNLQQAKIIIDTLDMLKEKTKNNLTEQEANMFENILYELKIKYVAKQK